MKKRFCKPLLTLFVVATFIVTLAINSYAVNLFTSVDLEANKTYALSSNFSAKSCYIDGNTYNNPVSTQDMRAQFHYKSSGNWVYDVRIFLGAGQHASITNSSIFSANHTWRLGLSPKIESNKGVSGSGKAKFEG